MLWNNHGTMHVGMYQIIRRDIHPGNARRFAKINNMNPKGFEFLNEFFLFYMQFIKQIAKTVTVFHQGKVLVEDTMENVQGNPTVREVYLGHDDDD